MLTSQDILDRLQIDPGHRTLGQLLQDREAAVHEIRKLRLEIEHRGKAQALTAPAPLGAGAEPDPPRPMLIRLADLCELLGVSRSTIYKWVSDGTFPAPLHVGERAVRWRMQDVETWRDAL
jgi:prophage regulatory protein